MKKIILLGFLCLFSFTITFAQSRYGCQNADLSGEYLLITDSDGTTPRDDATITLTLTGKTAVIHAIMPDVDVSSNGSYSACQNLVTMSFEDFDFTAENENFELIGNTLTLPFLVLGGAEEGSSTWKRISDVENSEDQANNESGSDSNNGGNSGDSGSNGDNGSSSNNNDSNNNNNGDSSNNSNNSSNENDASSNTDEIEPYVGDYIGTGWGWEVRFKHTSGDFVSQFTGADKDALPFEGDKIIMTLMVQHAVKFKIHINEDGEVSGEGEIIYNLIPNLCGVAVLTEQVNSAINLMGE